MNITKTVTMTNTSAVLTGLNSVTGITTGLFVYGDGISVGSTILSINSTLKQITLTIPATKTQTKSVETTTASRDVYLERFNALTDIYNVMKERGDIIEFMVRGESDVVRDSYNSIDNRKNQTSYFFRAFPVDFQPSTKKLEKAGLREECNVLIYTSMQEWINNGIDYNDIEINGRSTIKLQGNVYEIKEKALYGQFNDTFLYVTFGLFKR
jgi:hypothetical protein